MNSELNFPTKIAVQSIIIGIDVPINNYTEIWHYQPPVPTGDELLATDADQSRRRLGV